MEHLKKKDMVLVKINYQNRYKKLQKFNRLLN